MVSKENKIGALSISKHTYTVNSIGQRTQRAQTGSAFATASTEAFGYNTRGEVISSTNTQRPAFNTAFTYDGIGNRQTSQDSYGQRNYTANALNQYSKIASNVPTYDLDGNMLTDGAGVQYAWDAENRLTQVSLTGGKVVRYSYDAGSRRVKREYLLNGALQEAIRYLYDGWNLVAEYPATGTTPTKTYLWGQGVGGGVGGLLSIKEGSTVRAYTYDGNGNVSEVIAGNAVVAHYEYDPFGNTTVATGAYAATNPWRFSTKSLDANTNLYYYGYRWYDATNGRWPNRDPIGENGGFNVYVVLNNAAINYADALGLLLTPYTGDTSTIALVPSDETPSFGTAGEAGIKWPDAITKVSDKKLTLTGEINFTPVYYTKTITDPNDPKTLDRLGNTVTRHEQTHDEKAKVAWNHVVTILNRFERKYCSSNCASLASDLVVYRNRYARYTNSMEQFDFDMAAYGAGNNEAAFKTLAKKSAVEREAKDALKLFNETMTKFVKSECSFSD